MMFWGADRRAMRVTVCTLMACLLIVTGIQAQSACSNSKHPIVILPGIMASQINATYNGFAAGSPCVGRRSMTTVWPPSAKLILPTGLNCWMYMIQTKYNYRRKTFSNNKGVKVYIEPGGPSGTEYGLWQSSYTNLTTYLTEHFGYTLGKDMFGAPFDWRLHLTGMEKAGQLSAMASRIESIVGQNCGKKAIIIGHSMGGLVTLALLHRDPTWSKQYIAGFISVSTPYGGTTDQAIAVRLGSVDFNINDWVKLPFGRAAEDVAANQSASAEVAVAVANMQADTSAYGYQPPLSPDGVISVPYGMETIEVPTAATSRLRVRRPSRRVSTVATGSVPDADASRKRVAAAAAVKDTVANVKDRVSTAALFSMDRLLNNYVSGIFFKATMGLAGLSMLLPYSSAYGANRRIVVTERKTYTTSMMQQLMKDIGDTVTDRAWKQVHELDALLAKGKVPGVPTHCIYAVGKGTSVTWNFPNIRENKPLLTSTPVVTTGGDGTVSMQSLRQCYRVTDDANITELGDYGHLEVLKDRSTLAELGKALSAILQPQQASDLSAAQTMDNTTNTSSSSLDAQPQPVSDTDIIMVPLYSSSSSDTDLQGSVTDRLLPSAETIMPILGDAQPSQTEQILLKMPPETMVNLVNVTTNTTEVDIPAVEPAPEEQYEQPASAEEISIHQTNLTVTADTQQPTESSSDSSSSHSSAETLQPDSPQAQGEFLEAANDSSLDTAEDGIAGQSASSKKAEQPTTIAAPSPEPAAGEVEDGGSPSEAVAVGVPDSSTNDTSTDNIQGTSDLLTAAVATDGDKLVQITQQQHQFLESLTLAVTAAGSASDNSDADSPETLQSPEEETRQQDVKIHTAAGHFEAAAEDVDVLVSKSTVDAMVESNALLNSGDGLQSGEVSSATDAAAATADAGTTAVPAVSSQTEISDSSVGGGYSSSSSSGQTTDVSSSTYDIGVRKPWLLKPSLLDGSSEAVIAVPTVN